MADSNITKKALAGALKELMDTKPFQKISVSDICERCQMNRKSFYYHFKDKYDLMNWIYDTEFIGVAKNKNYQSGWELAEDVCEYFYDNRDFYRKALRIDEQNCFSEHFRGIAVIILYNDLGKFFGEDDDLSFYVDFYADALVCAIKRWLVDKDCMPASKFVRLIKRCLMGISDEVAEGHTSALVR